MEQVIEKMDTMTQENPWALGYHVQAEKGWINDPNGLCFHKGRYHVFFQHHPHSPQWGPMHWGHVSSTDLVHWERHPIALTPGKEGMCFSGSAVTLGEELALIYTGHQWLKEAHNDDYMIQKQCLATSQDGVHFEKKGEIIQQAYSSEIVHFRDPKVWFEDSVWHMVVGVKENNQGKIAYYQSADIYNWKFINTLSVADEERDEGYMWECPDFFKLGDQHVLVCSPQGMSPQGAHRRNLFQNGYFTGSFDKERGQFIRGNFVELDYGHDFYACQTFEDEKGRRIAMAWMDMWESVMPEQKYGRAGALTIPRELTIDDYGHIYQKPVDELHLLRQGKLLKKEKVSFPPGRSNIEAVGKHLEIQFTLILPNLKPYTNESKKECLERSGLLVRCGHGQFTYIGYDAMSNRVFIDRNRSGEGVCGIRYTPPLCAETPNKVDFQIFIDSSSIEVFVDQGRYTLTSRIYPNHESQGVEFISENGGSNIEDLIVYELSCPML